MNFKHHFGLDNLYYEVSPLRTNISSTTHRAFTISKQILNYRMFAPFLRSEPEILLILELKQNDGSLLRQEHLVMDCQDVGFRLYQTTQQSSNYFLKMKFE